MVTGMRFDGKVAVVTGASRGIGRAIALALAREGCNVVVNYEKNRDKANEVVEAIRRTKAEAIAAKCDVSVRNEVEVMFKTTVDEFGKVDILANNAAIGVAALLLETSDELWDRTLNVNLKGVFLCTQVAREAHDSEEVRENSQHRVELCIWHCCLGRDRIRRI